MTISGIQNPEQVSCSTGDDASGRKENGVSLDHTGNNGKNLKALKVYYVVEPSPITYFSGFAAQFQPLFKHLLNHFPDDQLELVTCDAVCPNLPRFWPEDKQVAVRDFPIQHTGGYPLYYFYPTYTLSLDWSFKIARELFHKQPDLIHTSSPSAYSIACVLYSRLFGIPLLMSYHTHLPLLVYPIFSRDKTLSKSGSIGRSRANHPISNFMLNMLEWCGKYFFKLGLLEYFSTFLFSHVHIGRSMDFLEMRALLC
jgi:Glycosyltransferase Family 4